MKPICTLFTALMLTIASGSFAQTTYAITSNTSRSASCSNCTFTISSGVTLTLSSSGTCSNCTFNGGNIDVQSTVTCQPCSFNNNTITMNNQSIKPNSGTTSFTGVTLTATGSSSIYANTPVTITNSTFTFSNTSYFFNNGGQLDISNSKLYFYNSAYFSANAGPVNLKNGSKLVAGDGTLSSTAYIKINGPALNLYDNTSMIILGNYNNSYFNWSSYNSISNSKSFTTTYPSAASTLNCGNPGQNSCPMYSSPLVYGPAGLTSTGVFNLASLLPVVLTNFTATATDGRVALQWSTAQENNASFFAIERSSNGATFTKIGQVNANGNTNTVSRYAFSDANPLNGTAYYRLAMTDVDGKVIYSDIKTVNASVIKSFSVYPNPAVENVAINLANNSSEVSVRLLTLSGQVLQERKAAAGISLVSMNVKQYPQGMYIIMVTAAGGAEQTAKLMIAH
ncbi:MAG: T9SS type A sorting domain-containing protein [Chitinophagaceae bacterium]